MNKKYYIYTFGCKVNRYETQLITDKLKKDGGVAADLPENADVIIFNSCTVTENADKECKYYLRKTLKLKNNPQIILTGCMAKNKNAKLEEEYPGVKIVSDKENFYMSPNEQTIENFDGRRRAFLKIQDGCNSFCSYCIVPYVRNTLWSKPENIVLEEIKNLVKKGYAEIVLTGIHVGKWQGEKNKDKEVSFSDLIEKIVVLPLDFRIRISSIEPNEIDDKLINLMKNNPDKICRHLHVPLQSGSDEVLKKMNRKYFTKDYTEKINNILKQLPNLALTTDIITGFPGETNKHHNETLKFVKQTQFARFHIFRYSDRTGTKASQFENKISPAEVKARSEELFSADAQKRKEFLQKNIGKKRKAVRVGKNKVLTDNYIERQMSAETSEKIFEIIIDENCKI
ncbi:MiaB/RimO family radical SAM methylthiotransferase [Endomicrobium proavitum]|uniref:tRNA N(6)-threonylcarbamoyladenosine (T(6)A) methylthiotransferase n=1 Tax=Endomicrobium proavitum TaxID=1408281 RepID=A0A0G3WJW7_9BACT|nr:MiaB/RimO family radical SAM methylthiotransferase [Endomicrobium proavitum]AKL98185.1 tRNA N(6)-threonylcarbamoyladenosine (t(6)A) methylthiotransferase [Endomicrobium proavitum]